MQAVDILPQNNANYKSLLLNVKNIMACRKRQQMDCNDSRKAIIFLSSNARIIYVGVKTRITI